MKIKLVKVKTLSETVTYNDDDDFLDITRHLVENYSDFEEVDGHNLSRIQDWVQEYNRQSFAEFRGEYILLVTDEVITVKSVIDDIIKKENALLKKYRDDEKKKEEKRVIEKQNRAAKKLERLKRQLEKAEKEAAGEKN